MRARRFRGPVLAAVVLAGLAAAADPAGAIPAFARRYDLSCSACHGPFPRLKPWGEEFAGNGFRLAHPSLEPAHATRETNDPMLALLRELPLAVRLEGYMAAHEDAAAESDLETPWVFKVLSGGPLAPRVSYYFYFIVEQGDVTGLEDAYLHFSKLFGSGIDLLFGQFQVSDPLFKREIRLERNDYDIYRARVGAARANLTYDRGLMFVTTAPGDVDVVLEIVNGNGIPKGEFDNDSNKNVALRLAREFGPVRLGLFGYRGEEEAADTGASDRITYFGPDLRFWSGGRFELALQYLERRDDDPFFLGPAAGGTLATRGGFAELLFFPGGEDGRWALAALYNRVDSDDPAAELEDASLTVSYLSARNVRLVAEAGHDLERDASHLSLGVVTAF